ncbi:MAG: RNA polymerase sigma factor [Thermoanaerobacteraceae bacterium]|nr:RNA polymerase sigma factor [Thermoanaerobacteraceae bacterium]
MHIRGNLYGPDAFENDSSFEEAFAQNEKKILNLIYGMLGDYHLAQDLTQETFMKAFMARKSFNGKSKFSTWLYRIAVNVAIDHQRKSSVRREVTTEKIKSDLPGGSTCSDPDHV